MTASDKDLHFGITCSGFYPGRQYIEAVERLGFDSFWTGEHIMYKSPVQDGIPVLGAAAAVTSNITIGSAVLLPPLHHPVVLAKSISTLDLISGGRMVVGVGAGGEWEPEFEACGVPVKRRGARLDASLQIMKCLWSGETVDHVDEFWSIRKAHLDPLPPQMGQLPVWIGGRSNRAMKRAIEMGHGYIPYLVSRDAYAARREAMAASALESGRTLGSEFAWALRCELAGAARGQVALELAKRSLNQKFGPGLSDDQIKKYCIVGSWGDCEEQLQAWREVGVTHFIFQPVSEPGREMSQLESSFSLVSGFR